MLWIQEFCGERDAVGIRMLWGKGCYGYKDAVGDRDAVGEINALGKRMLL